MQGWDGVGWAGGRLAGGGSWGVPEGAGRGVPVLEPGVEGRPGWVAGVRRSSASVTEGGGKVAGGSGKVAGDEEDLG